MMLKHWCSNSSSNSSLRFVPHSSYLLTFK
uniref:Uncharacterized protein n=1 Tax=Anguilla anguilla TaxID=7936 RepID=A0A0E9SDU5_ANGAN